MIIIFIGYLAVVLLWLTLWYVERKHSSLWWLLGASILVAIAWFLNSVWISLLGMLCALTSVSFTFKTLTEWLQKKTVSRSAIIVWLEWLFVLCVTIAHIYVLMLTIIYEASH